MAPRAGAFRRVGGTVTVTPAADFVLRREDGSRLDGETRVHRVLAGPFRLDVTDVGDDRRWVTATDTTHRAITAPPPLPSYPLDGQWRVTARFDRFDAPKGLRVPDVQGGSMEVTALGQLVFRLKGEEFRLTAIGQRLAVWFKDPTKLDDLSWVPRRQTAGWRRRRRPGRHRRGRRMDRPRFQLLVQSAVRLFHLHHVPVAAI